MRYDIKPFGHTTHFASPRGVYLLHVSQPHFVQNVTQYVDDCPDLTERSL